MRRKVHPIFSARGKTLPLSTLLLAALCVLLAAPSSHAAPQKYSHDAILSVLQESLVQSLGQSEVLAPRTSPSKLSVLEIHKLRAALCQLDQSQLVELQKQITAHSDFNHCDFAFEKTASPQLIHFVFPRIKYSAPSLHLYAREIIARTSHWLE